MSFDDETSEHSEATLEAHERRITRCKSCGARIVFLETETGRRMPTDADTVEPDDTLFDAARHDSHFASCSHGDRHRRPR